MTNYQSTAFEPVEIRLLDRKEAAHFLHIGENALKELVRRGRLRAIRFNSRLVRYQMKDLIRLANEGAVAPTEQKEGTAKNG